MFEMHATPLPKYLNRSVRVNGQPHEHAGPGRWRFKGKHVSRQLFDAVFPWLAGADGKPWRNRPPAMQTRLESSGLRNGDALWSYQASFEWNQSFEPGETRIELRYAPAFDDWADFAIDHFPEIAPGGSTTRAYCIVDALRQAFFRKPFYDLYTVTHFSAPPSTSRGPVVGRAHV